MKKKTIIGVTGGLASGKSTVSGMFEALGAVKIDADAIAHRLLVEDAGIVKKIVGVFGEDVAPGGRIDRKRLAAKVFFDKAKRGKLARIMHPEIIRTIIKEAGKVKEGVVVIDAPLLIEAGMEKVADIVVVVTASRKTQVKRAIERGISKEQAEAIIRSQMPLSEKEKAADYIISSEESLESTKKGVDGIWKRNEIGKKEKTKTKKKTMKKKRA